MNYQEYKEQMTNIAMKYDKKYRGAKYVRRWERFYDEKSAIVDYIFSKNKNIKSALDIGTGVGMLPYILQQKNVEVEGTDITEDITGTMFTECCNLINLTRYQLYVTPGKSMNLSKHYDLIISTRTEFDRQEGFDWNEFINDAFNFCNVLYIKTNIGSKACPFPESLREFCFNSSFKLTETVSCEAWSFYLEKDQWNKNSA